jgi:methionine sulfoxide reductase heme-binding subunit
MTLPAATLGPSDYWYLARGTGAVALVLLTVSVVIGIVGTLRVSALRWPRFAVDTVHRDVSLLVIVLLVVHIVTSVLDGFAPISLIDSIIPLHSSYRPVWLGLGALSFDLLLALAITSLVRRRLGYRRWRAIHWLAYASWPVAVLHGLGTGTDTKVWWMLALTAVCVTAVAAAICVRVARAEDPLPGLRTPFLILGLGTPVALAAFTVLGPLASGWAQRAGTPASLLGRARPAAELVQTRPAGSGTGSGPSAFRANLAGSIRQTSVSGGSLVDMTMRLSGAETGQLRVRLAGAALSSGGLTMTGSQVDLIARGWPDVLQGQISSLAGQDLEARVVGSSGRVLDLRVRLHVDSQSGTVTGTLDASS